MDSFSFQARMGYSSMSVSARMVTRKNAEEKSGMTLKVFWVWAATAAWLILIAPASAQDFYKGKSIRLIVGASAGGGYDTYSRTIARHMGKHIPGNPVFVVENMPGAGFLISANYIYNIAK